MHRTPKPNNKTLILNRHPRQAICCITRFSFFNYREFLGFSPMAICCFLGDTKYT